MRTVIVGITLALLGVSLFMVGLGEHTARGWTVDPLRYRAVEISRPFRGSPSIHMKSVAGETYRLPERLWGRSSEVGEIARLLERDTVVSVRVTGGPAWLHGFPTVQHLELESASLTLDAPPPHPARAPALMALGPLFLLLGAKLIRAPRRGRSPGAPGRT